MLRRVGSWMFPPHKEVAVSECLNWIQHMSYGLANLGVRAFLTGGFLMSDTSPPGSQIP
jgi:hypothetical protein